MTLKKTCDTQEGAKDSKIYPCMLGSFHIRFSILLIPTEMMVEGPSSTHEKDPPKKIRKMQQPTGPKVLAILQGFTPPRELFLTSGFVDGNLRCPVLLILLGLKVKFEFPQVQKSDTCTVRPRNVPLRRLRLVVCHPPPC